jgi:8-oxo-dGTP diphosphatase
MRVVTVAYLALARTCPHRAPALTPQTRSGARSTGQLHGTQRLAFDHADILRDGIERARAKLEYTPLGAAFCPTEFTVAELRRVYEIVWDVEIDARNFHRKATKTTGLLIPAGQTTTRDGGRPAQLYRRGPTALLYPPLMRNARSDNLDQ